MVFLFDYSCSLSRGQGCTRSLGGLGSAGHKRVVMTSTEIYFSCVAKDRDKIRPVKVRGGGGLRLGR